MTLLQISYFEFTLSDFFGKRYQKLAGEYYQVNRNLSVRRAAWGGLLSMLGSLGYYTAYAAGVWCGFDC